MDYKVTIPYPVCWMCKTKIKDMTIEPSATFDGFVVTVRCHGKQEQCTLSYDLIENAIAIHPGYAFKR